MSFVPWFLVLKVSMAPVENAGKILSPAVDAVEQIGSAVPKKDSPLCVSFCLPLGSSSTAGRTLCVSAF